MKNYFYLLFVLGLNLIYGQEYEADIFVNQKPTPPSSNQIGRKVFRVMCPSVRIHRDGTVGYDNPHPRYKLFPNNTPLKPQHLKQP